MYVCVCVFVSVCVVDVRACVCTRTRVRMPEQVFVCMGGWLCECVCVCCVCTLIRVLCGHNHNCGHGGILRHCGELVEIYVLAHRYMYMYDMCEVLHIYFMPLPPKSSPPASVLELHAPMKSCSLELTNSLQETVKNDVPLKKTCSEHVQFRKLDMFGTCFF